MEINGTDVMPEKSEMLLPYCNKCGEYKGLGPCKICNSTGTDSVIKDETCSRCIEPMKTRCQRCGSSFCSTHSQGSQQQNLVDNSHTIGTCARCGILVCEDCWILDEFGRIICLEHFEEDR
ncbi:MAG: hypothetical protein ACTSUB_09030 [Candidatus Thorarchaeota archaeon]